METLAFDNQRVFLFTTSEIMTIVQCLAEARPKSELFESARRSAIVKIRETLEGELVKEEEKEKEKHDGFFVCCRCKNVVIGQDFTDHVRICHEKMT